MKLTLIIFAVLILMAMTALAVMAHQSKSLTPQLGLQAGKLTSCVRSTNCVNSMTGSDVAPIEFVGSAEQVWQEVLVVISDLGGVVQQQKNNYLWATFKTPLMGFVDDVELLLLAEKQVIHIRSGSRVGRSDFGANKKRVELIRATLAEK